MRPSLSCPAVTPPFHYVININYRRSYYRTRVQESEAIVQDALGRLTCLEVCCSPPLPPTWFGAALTRSQGSAVEREKRIWEHNRLLNDVHDLNVAVREANLNLFAERERALELAAENDMLKAQEIEDRRRIQQLMDIAQPLAHDVTYFTDTNPSSHSNSGGGGGKFRLSVPRGESSQQQQERALRAVFQAQPSNDTMQLRVESLELQVGLHCRLACLLLTRVPAPPPPPPHQVQELRKILREKNAAWELERGYHKYAKRHCSGVERGGV